MPALAECLTLNKADFLRTGPRGATYLAYRRAIQEAVSQQLAAWGDARDAGGEARRRVARPLERDLERVVNRLAGAFPLLGSLVHVRSGGQVRLPIGRAGRLAPEAAPVASLATVADQAPPVNGTAPSPEHAEPAVEPSAANGDEPRRPARYGMSIQFDERPEDPEPGRLVESTVWVNAAHPAYRRAVASRSEGYHVAVAAALALARVAVKPVDEHGFLRTFLARWGEVLDAERGRRRPR